MWDALKQGPPLLAILLLLNTSCAVHQSESRRARSYEPFVNARIGEVEAGAFIKSRVALLIASEKDPLRRWQQRVTLEPGAVVGCAAAIDSRGYFLTAAHCLKHEFVYLLVYESQRARAFRASVVWRGNKRRGQQDLAILKVAGKLSHTFDWAEEVTESAPVMAIGLSWTNKPGTDLKGFQLMGGSILKIDHKSAESSSIIKSDLPLQSGDSGGPVVDKEGRLAGISVRATPPLVHRVLSKHAFPTLAERPDLVWLRETVEKDASRNSAASHQP